MLRLSLFFLVQFSILVSVLAQTNNSIQSSIDDFSKDKYFKNATIGIHVVNLKDGKEIAAYNSEKSLATASVLKLISTATALQQKGVEYTYNTPIMYSGIIEKGILKGNLIIKGVGDPTFNSKYFKTRNVLTSILTIINDAGIKEIEGDVILNSEVFNAEVAPTWSWEDVGNYYGATSHPINYNDNLYEVFFKTLNAGTHAEIVDVKPNPHLNIINKVISSSVNKDGAYIFGAPFGKKRIIKGTLPQNRKSFVVKGALPNPSEIFGEELISYLRKNEIIFSGKLSYNSKIKKAIKIGEIVSPKLKDIIKQTNYKSINLYAESMLYLVNSINSDRNTILKSIKSYWKSQGLDVSGLYMYDGSGLSRFNAVTPSFFTSLLFYMSKSTYAKFFKESLPISGISGTLKYLGDGTELEGRVYAKSGSMSQVCSYAGYITTMGGEELGFSVIINNYKGNLSTVRRKISTLLLRW